jgi:hypothetical protein
MIIGTSPRTAVALPVLSVALLAIATTGNGETIVFGGGPGSRAWDQAHSEVTAIDFEATPGSIHPLLNDPEDNIALQLLAQGGQITSPNAHIELQVTPSAMDGLLNRMVDGSGNTAFEVKLPRTTGIRFRVDLGERFGVNRIRFAPREGFEGFFLKGYEVALNDGSEEQTTRSGFPDFRVFKRSERNRDPVVDLRVPLQVVRFIEVRQLVRGEWEIDEFQVFGEGFARAAAYTSSVFDERGPAVFGDITWALETIGEPVKVSATVSTRSGRTPDPSDGQEWSRWSFPYPAGAPTQIESPAPRRYWQFRVLFQSEDIRSAAVVDSIAVEVSPALADSVVGEVWPQKAVVGPATELTYWVRSYNSDGFDRLDIETPARVEVVRSVQVDGSDVAWDKEDIVDDRGDIVGVRISFPRVTGDDRLLRVVFESILLNYDTVFVGRVFDTQRPQRLPLTLIPGDVAADPVAEGDDLSVTTRVVGNRIIHGLDVDPTPFTPNGDGVNDETTITYGIANLTSVAPVSVVVYDLAGRPLKVVYSGHDVSRSFARLWDGTGDDGQKLPPGLYVVRLEVDADTGTESRTAIVPIVY